MICKIVLRFLQCSFIAASLGVMTHIDDALRRIHIDIFEFLFIEMICQLAWCFVNLCAEIWFFCRNMNSQQHNDSRYKAFVDWLYCTMTLMTLSGLADAYVSYGGFKCTGCNVTISLLIVSACLFGISAVHTITRLTAPRSAGLTEIPIQA